MPKPTVPFLLLASWLAGASVLAGCRRPTPPPDAAPPSPAALSFVFGDGFLKEEMTPAATFRWARQTANVRLTVPAAGRYRLTFRPVTVFSPKENIVEIRVNGEKIGEAATHTFDFAHAQPTILPTVLKAGENEVVLQSDAPEVQLGQDDPRTPSFGLVMPIGVEGAP